MIVQYRLSARRERIPALELGGGSSKIGRKCGPRIRPRGFVSSELERIAATDHRVAILEPAKAAIHRASREDEAELAFPAMPVPPVDVRLAPQEVALVSRSRSSI